MLKLNTGLRFGKLLLGAVLIAGLAGPAFAGNVYSWVTEDGTHSFTDDSKRIPAKHQANAKWRPMGKLARYERFTEIVTERGKPYVERLRDRQNDLRGMPAVAPTGVVAGGPTTSGRGIGYTIPVSGRAGTGGSASLWVPVTGSTSVDSQPTTIESIRVKPTDSLATRHWTVIKKGDDIVTVIKGERRQRSLRSVSEKDFDL